jgi:hypothetical protein
MKCTTQNICCHCQAPFSSRVETVYGVYGCSGKEKESILEDILMQ